MLLLCFKLSSCLVTNTSDTSVMYEKAKFVVVFLYLMRPQNMKFESVQINMKHVLYSMTVKLLFEQHLEFLSLKRRLHRLV